MSGKLLVEPMGTEATQESGTESELLRGDMRGVVVVVAIGSILFPGGLIVLVAAVGTTARKAVVVDRSLHRSSV